MFRSLEATEIAIFGSFSMGKQVAVLAKDYGWKTTAIITLANFAVAIVVGGIAFRLLSLVIPTAPMGSKANNH